MYVFSLQYLNDIGNRFETVDDHEEIYSSIHQSSGPSLLTRSDKIDMTGFLNKRSKNLKLTYLICPPMSILIQTIGLEDWPPRGG